MSLKTRKRNLKNNLFKTFLSIAAVVFITACDFTPRIFQDILLAQEYVTNQNYQGAIDKYESILDENPSNEVKLKIYYQLGKLYGIYLHDINKAVSYFQKVKDVSDDPLWIVRTEEQIADTYFTFGDQFAESEQSYKTLLQFKPRLKKYDLYELRLGISYLKQDKLKESEKVFRGISLNADHEYYVDSFYYLGLINFQKKNWKAAIHHWGHYISIESDKSEQTKVKFLMANTYETMENLKEAYNMYYSLLGEYPNSEVIKEHLNSIYKRKVARKR